MITGASLDIRSYNCFYYNRRRSDKGKKQQQLAYYVLCYDEVVKTSVYLDGIIAAFSPKLRVRVPEPLCLLRE
jgi:hypothetical protein